MTQIPIDLIEAFNQRFVIIEYQNKALELCEIEKIDRIKPSVIANFNKGLYDPLLQQAEFVENNPDYKIKKILLKYEGHKLKIIKDKKISELFSPEEIRSIHEIYSTRKIPNFSKEESKLDCLIHNTFNQIIFNHSENYFNYKKDSKLNGQFYINLLEYANEINSDDNLYYKEIKLTNQKLKEPKEGNIFPVTTLTFEYEKELNPI